MYRLRPPHRFINSGFLLATVLLLGCSTPTAIKQTSPTSSTLSYQPLVKELGYQELADTFSRAKSLAISSAPNEQQLPLSELQAAAVLSLIGAPLDQDEQTLAEFVAHYAVVDTAYLGRLNESSLYQRLGTEWQRSSSVSRSAFALELRQLITQGIATGYNLVTSPWPVFVSERQVIYGHSNIQHAQQLLALLASEGIEARVGFSRKTSAFLYRDDWGTLNESLIDLGNNRRLVEASEYDLHFEFASAGDKSRFVSAIDRYAKKESATQTGLILGAWWQPFYRSHSAAQGFAEASQIRVSNGSETALLLALPAQAPTLVAAIQQLNPTWSVSAETLWVNLAFHRYLQGDFK